MHAWRWRTYFRWIFFFISHLTFLPSYSVSLHWRVGFRRSNLMWSKRTTSWRDGRPLNRVPSGIKAREFLRLYARIPLSYDPRGNTETRKASCVDRLAAARRVSEVTAGDGGRGEVHDEQCHVHITVDGRDRYSAVGDWRDEWTKRRGWGDVKVARAI